MGSGFLIVLLAMFGFMWFLLIRPQRAQQRKHAEMLGGLKPGDEVVTSPITFVSAVNVIEHMGAVPVFADVRPEDLTVDPESVRRRIGPRTTAIVATHFAGYPAHMDDIEEAARPRGLPVVTDAAHGIEAV